MDRKKASDFPQELLNLFDLYVHGDMSRRAFLDGAQKFAVGGVSAGALLEMLKPNYAWAHPGAPRRQPHRRQESRRAVAQRQRLRSRAISSGPPARRNCRPSWSCTRTAA